MVVVVALLAAMLGAPGAQATPLVPAAPPPTGQWLAEYYNNTTLTGAPVTSVLEPLGLPKQLDHNWGSGSPAAGVSADNFSARYSTTADFGDGGLVVFTSKSDDGVRVKVDGTWVINNWTDHSATVNSGVVPVTAGSHTVVVEYYERGYSAVVQLQWAPLSPDQWYAEYFNNTTLTGTPVRAGLEPRQYLLHDWGYGAPPGVNADNFSARFTTTFQCCDGWALHFTSYSGSAATLVDSGCV